MLSIHGPRICGPGLRPCLQQPAPNQTRLEPASEARSGEQKRRIKKRSHRITENTLDNPGPVLRAPNPAQPGLSRSNGGHPQREGTNLVVCLFLKGWYYPGVTLQIWVCLICVISPYSNGAVQIRVGLVALP